VANSLKNVCEKLTHTHGGVYLVVLAHFLNRSLEVTKLYTAQRPDVGWRVRSCVLEKGMALVNDRTLASARLARPVSGSSWVWSRSSDRTLNSKSDQIRRACVRSGVTYADIGHETWRAEENKGSDDGLHPVRLDLTCPIVF
jgi:hypothetical protein